MGAPPADDGSVTGRWSSTEKIFNRIKELPLSSLVGFMGVSRYVVLSDAR
jgi:hypothetical protein